MFTLGDVYRAVGRPPPAGADAMRIEAAHYDSRRTGPNMLFVALPGERVDGNDFIADALVRSWATLAPSPKSAPTMIMAPPRTPVVARLANASEATAVPATTSPRLNRIAISLHFTC